MLDTLWIYGNNPEPNAKGRVKKKYIGTSGWRSSRSAFRRSTGKDVVATINVGVAGSERVPLAP